VKYAGQPVGIIVAENRAAALQSAAKVVIKYASVTESAPSAKLTEQTKEKLVIIKSDLGKTPPKCNQIYIIFLYFSPY